MTAGAAICVSDEGWRSAVLRFWYRELEPPQWFIKSDAVDQAIVARFAGLWEDLRAYDAAALSRDAKGALAAVLVLDQFPRNMFRGTARAFASDVAALAVAHRTIALGFDRLLRRDERLFLYLPYEHAEDATLQARSVELVTRLGNPEWTRYAQAHKAIVDRFGRFPHRNAALGRATTAEETAFLQTPGSGF